MYYQQPSTADDLRFVLRCLWALDPNRHLFADIPFHQYLWPLVKISVGPGEACPSQSMPS